MTDQQKRDQEAADKVWEEFLLLSYGIRNGLDAAKEKPYLAEIGKFVRPVFMKGIAYRDANPVDLKKSIESLDGVAAVNLDEPCPGDLERIVNAYRDERARLKKVREAINNHVETQCDGCGLNTTNVELVEALAFLDGKEK